jgi:stage II sporulation protein M
MKRNLSKGVYNLMMASGTSFATTLFFFFFGISAGVFTELMMESGEKENIRSYLDKYFLLSDLDNVTFQDIFFTSAGNNLGFLIIIILSGLTAIGFPVVLATLIYKGMALGFSAALLIDSMSHKGVALVLTSMLPQNLIFIPVLILGGVVALNLAFYTFSNRRSGIKKSLRESSGPYFTINLILAIAIIVGCFVESAISPLLTQLIV